MLVARNVLRRREPLVLEPMMEIDRHTRVMNIVNDPELRAVLEWYGLPVHDRGALRLSLENFCSAHDVDVEDLLLELSLGENDDDAQEDEDWMGMRG